MFTRREPPAAATPPDAKEYLEEIARVRVNRYWNVLAFSPDNQRVAIDNGPNIKLVELKTGKVLRDFQPGQPMVGDTNRVMSMVILPEGQIVASYEDQMIRVWDSADARIVRDLGGGPQGDRFKNLRYSPTGKWVVGHSPAEIRIWDPQTGRILGQHPAPSPVEGLDLHPDGRSIASVHKDNVIRIWDAPTGRPVVEEFSDHTKMVNRLRFSPGGRHLLCLPGGAPEFLLVNPKDGRVTKLFPGARTKVVDAVFFSDGGRVASIHANNIFYAWSVDTGKILSFKPFAKEVRCLGMSPDGEYVVVLFRKEAVLYRWRD